MNVSFVFLKLVAAIFFLAANPYYALTQAQDYPRKPVRMIVPLSPGGATDFAARIAAQELTTSLRQQFFVDNRPGAGSTIGTALAAKSPPDGHTLLVVSTTVLAVSPNLYSNLAYDVLRDFVPIATLTITSEFIIVHPSLPVKSIKELVRLAKSRPREIFYASAGSGTINHLEIAMLVAMTGIEMEHVPHKGGDASVMSVVSGATQVGADVMPRVGHLLTNGRVRVIAVTGPRRSPFMPNVPTMKESGVPDYEAQLWSGVVAPAGTPDSVIRKLSSAIAEIREMPNVRERFTQGGLVLFSLTPEKFADFIRAEHAKWGKMVRVVGARID